MKEKISSKNENEDFQRQNEYKCEECNKTYGKKGFLVKHIRLKHSNEKYNCKSCESEFIQEVLLKIHTVWCKKNRPPLFFTT